MKTTRFKSLCPVSVVALALILLLGAALGRTPYAMASGSAAFADPIVIGDDEFIEFPVDFPSEETDWDWQERISDIHASEIVYLDVMFVYNADIRNSPEEILIRAVESANQIFENSKVHIRLNPVKFVATDLVPSDGFNADRALHVKLNGNLKNLATQQYLSGADIVAGLYDYNGYICGGGGSAARLGSLREVIDAQIIMAMCGEVTNGYLLAHELGHTLGLSHSRRQDSQGATFPFALGHGVDDVLSTIMAYPDVFHDGGDKDYHVFSNPHLMCGEVACGVSEVGNPSDSANAALALNLVRFQAAEFNSVGRAQVPIAPAIEAIADSGLRACLEEFQAIANRTYTGQVYELDCRGRSISSLEGIEAFEYLRRLRISDNPVGDLGPLAELDHLVSLRANDAEVSDLTPLLQLQNLERIQVKSDHPISCWQRDYLHTTDELRFYMWPETCHTDDDEGDFDGDGLSNRFELDQGSNPVIPNDEPSIFQFKFTEHALFESEGVLKLTVTRGLGQSAHTSVSVRSVAGTASEGENFVPLDLILHFDQYERHKEIALEVMTNPESQEDRVLTLELSEPVNASLGSASVASVTIYPAGQQVPRRVPIRDMPAPAPPPQASPPPQTPSSQGDSGGGNAAFPLAVLCGMLAFSMLARRRKAPC